MVQFDGFLESRFQILMRDVFGAHRSFNDFLSDRGSARDGVLIAGGSFDWGALQLLADG